MPVVTSPAAIPTSLPPSGAAGGDLGGTYPNPSVDLNTAGGTIAGPLVVNNATTPLDVKVSNTTALKVRSDVNQFTQVRGLIADASQAGINIYSSDNTKQIAAFDDAGSAAIGGFAPGNFGLQVGADGHVYIPVGIYTYVITAGALPTTSAFVSGTGKQILATRDVDLVVPVTSDGTNNAATCAVALSPDDSTYSALYTWSIAAAVNLVGAVTNAVVLHVPAGWYVKLTTSRVTIGTGTYY